MAFVYLGIAYELKLLGGGGDGGERRGVRQWKFYPRIGDGEAQTGLSEGALADAHDECRAAIRFFLAKMIGGQYYGPFETRRAALE